MRDERSGRAGVTRPEGRIERPTVDGPRAAAPRAGSAQPGERCETCLLRRHSLFQNLNVDELADLQRIRGRDRAAMRGQIIARAGDPMPEPCTLLSGWAGSIRMLESGRRQLLSIHLPGDFIGRHALGATEGWDHVVALTPVRLCSFKQAPLLAALQQHPKLALTLASMLAREEALLFEHISGLTRTSGQERICHFLLEIFDRLRQRGEARQGACALPLTHRDIADALGVSREHVSRVLRQLSQQGLASVSNRRLTIPDESRLARLVGYNPVRAAS